MSLLSVLKSPIISVVSSLGLGYLPTWHRHWSSFLAIVVCIFALHFDARLDGISLYRALFAPTDFIAFALSCDALIAAFHALWLTAVFGWVFLHICDEPVEHFTIDAFMSQLIVIALGMPAIMSIMINFIPSATAFMQNYLVFPEWIAALISLIMLFAVPFWPLRMFDIFEFWPVGFLRVRYPNNVAVPIISAFSSSFYTLFVLYIIAFVMFDLSPNTVIAFMSALSEYFALHLNSIFALLMSFFGADGVLYKYLHSLGLVDIVSNVVGTEGAGGDTVAQR